MNETVSKLVDIVFRDTERTEEVQVLYDQVLMDCQERFKDLQENGMDEDEAIAAVVESLRGMEEVLREFPQKSENAQGQTSAERTEEKGERLDCEAASVKKIVTAFRSCDLYVMRSSDDQVHVYTKSDKIHFSLSGNEIRAEEEEREAQAGFLKNLSWAFFHISWDRVSMQAVYMEVPETAVIQYDLQTEAGDIHWEGIHASSLTVKTVAGDLAVAELPCRIEKAEIRTTSGDIRLHRNASMGSLMIWTTTGDIRGESVFESMEAHTVSGEVGISGEGGSLRADTLSGDLELSGTYDTVWCKSMSGDLKIHVNCTELDASSTSGDLAVRGKIQSMKLQTTSGDIEACGGTESVRADSVSGDLTMDIKDSDPLRTVYAETRSGDIEIRLPENREWNVEMKTVSGDQRSSVRNASGDPLAGTICAKTISGDIQIH